MRLGVFLRELLKFCFQRGFGLLPGNARLQAPKSAHPGVVPDVQAASAGHELAVHHDGNPDVATQRGVAALKFARRDANDGEEMLVQGDGLAKDVGLAFVTVLPEAVTDDGNGSAVRLAPFCFEETSAPYGRDPQNLEVIGTYQGAENALGLVTVRYAHGPESEAG